MIVEGGFVLFNGPFAIIALMAMAIAMLVNRAGASMVFFDVVGRFQAQRLISDAETSMTVFNSIMLDTFANLQDSINVIGTQFESIVTEMLPMVEAMEDAEIELRKFLIEGEKLEPIAANVRAIGSEFGFTGDEALQAAAKMAQLASVLGPGMTETGTQLGMEFGLISGMETEQAMKRLINLNQQLHFMQEGTEELATTEEKALKVRENTLRVMDQLNTIENRSASTMEQVTYVMNQFASQANLTGESLAMMAAQSAVLIETGEEQGKAGRALRMVYARLGADTSGARKELQKHNIAVEDANGNMRPLSKILGDLNVEWSELEQNEKQAIAQSVAGNRHYTRFIKLMDNYDRSVELAHDAMRAMFPAIEEVNIRLDENITKYREAEAELSNYRAELGEALLPALTAATTKQGQFTNEIINMIEAFGGDDGFGARLVAIGLGMKNLIVPFMALVTNVAALTVAFQAQRAVTRAMAGDQLINAQAFGQADANYKSATIALKELAIVKDEIINRLTVETAAVKRLSDNQKIQTTSALATHTKNLASANARVAAEEKLVIAQKKKIMQTNKEIEGARANSLSVTELNKKLHEQKAELIGLQQELDKLIGIRQKHSTWQEKAAGKLAGDEIKKINDETEETKRLNEVKAAQAKALYSLGGAMMSVGSLFMLFGKSQKSMRIGMVLNTSAMVIMTGKQLALAASTLKNTVADMLGKQSLVEKNHEMWKGIIASISKKTATDSDTKAEVVNTAATAGNTVEQIKNTTQTNINTA